MHAQTLRCCPLNPARTQPVVPLLQATHFYEVVEYEMGWSNLLLRKQLFKAFDLEGHGDITFTEFCEGYSTMLRGTVPELQEFAWRVYHIQGDADLMSLTDVSFPLCNARPPPTINRHLLCCRH